MSSSSASGGVIGTGSPFIVGAGGVISSVIGPASLSASAPPIPNLPIQKAIVEKAICFDGYDVHIIARRMPMSTDMVLPLAPLALKTVNAGESYDGAPTFRLDPTAAQNLLDALWTAGLRPSSGSADNVANFAAVIEAQKQHIEDLRQVAGLTRTKDQPASGEPRF